MTEKGKVPPSDRTKCLLILEAECVSFATHRFCSQTIYEGFTTGDLDVEDEPHKASGVLHDIDKRPYAVGGGAKPTCDFINGTVTTGCRKYEEQSGFTTHPACDSKRLEFWSERRSLHGLANTLYDGGRSLTGTLRIPQHRRQARNC